MRMSGESLWYCTTGTKERMGLMMTNITIHAEENHATGGAYIQVKADTKRFGTQEVMFEGNTFDQCFDYIKRELGIDRVRLSSCFIFEAVTDREGRSFPCYMEVLPS